MSVTLFVGCCLSVSLVVGTSLATDTIPNKQSSIQQKSSKHQASNNETNVQSTKILTRTTNAQDANLQKKALRIGKVLRCPVCQGMPIADSPADMAQAMMKQVFVLLEQGKSEEEIFAFFVNRYGEWVLLAPKPRGSNLLLWIMPVLVLLLGGLAIFAYVVRSKKAPEIRG